eukprot:g51977.t1
MLVLELMHADLHTALEECGDKLPENQAALVIYRLADALSYLHQRGVVHRDVKPENVLLVYGQMPTDVKLTDFGAAKHLHNPQDTMHSSCGSPSYVAPEILRMEAYGAAVDIWSLGVILYRLLSGTLPFTKGDGGFPQLFAGIKKGEYSFPVEQWGNIDPEAKEGGPRHLICRCLTLDPSIRITAKEILTHPWIRRHYRPLIRLPVQNLPKISCISTRSDSFRNSINLSFSRSFLHGGKVHVQPKNGQTPEVGTRRLAHTHTGGETPFDPDDRDGTTDTFFTIDSTPRESKSFNLSLGLSSSRRNSLATSPPRAGEKLTHRKVTVRQQPGHATDWTSGQIVQSSSCISLPEEKEGEQEEEEAVEVVAPYGPPHQRDLAQERRRSLVNFIDENFVTIEEGPEDFTSIPTSSFSVRAIEGSGRNSEPDVRSRSHSSQGPSPTQLFSENEFQKPNNLKEKARSFTRLFSESEFRKPSKGRARSASAKTSRTSRRLSSCFRIKRASDSQKVRGRTLSRLTSQRLASSTGTSPSPRGNSGLLPWGSVSVGPSPRDSSSVEDGPPSTIRRLSKGAVSHPPSATPSPRRGSADDKLNAISGDEVICMCGLCNFEVAPRRASGSLCASLTNHPPSTDNVNTNRCLCGTCNLETTPSQPSAAPPPQPPSTDTNSNRMVCLCGTCNHEGIKTKASVSHVTNPPQPPSTDDNSDLMVCLCGTCNHESIKTTKIKKQTKQARHSVAKRSGTEEAGQSAAKKRQSQQQQPRISWSSVWHKPREDT